jgi:hypothetical protein
MWLSPKGTLLVEGKPAPARITKGARTVGTPFGYGLDLDGTHGGLLIPDLPALALTRAMTVSTWVYLRGYVSDGPGAQLLFRGDDRPGHDPYDFVLRGNGTIEFGIGSDDDHRPFVATEIPLRQWVRVTASYEAATGEMKLWMGDRLVATRVTEIKPFRDLDQNYLPGVGIGNVETDGGFGNNQPLNGILADMRLYPTVLEPALAGWRPWTERP